MDPERWKRVEKILAEALDLAPERRDSFLDSACDGDPDLRREVEELLEMAPEASSFWSTPPSGGHGDSPDRAAVTFTGDLAPGSVIGSYRVERLLGSGGMGAVYLASRADEAYEQRVAVKVLHPGFAGPGVTARFLAERQILAVLDHPNIARLLDGGATSSGQPFLVMEHVEGIPIDRYCEQHGMGVEERLEVFLKVCNAAAFAHRNLVVHRDIKPSNILVTEDGEPKLLDFGIAKLLDTSAFPEMDELTQTGMRPMSPAYASPEQIGGRPITTASDVYSLGVVLYKLLTGRLPHDTSESAITGRERTGRAEPTRPSVAVTETASPGEDRDEQKRLKRRLEGDIDTIVLTALRDEPERRYGTVDELADDIGRHLDGRTVNARPSTLTYRAVTFVRRYRGPVAAAVIVAGLMIAAIVALTVQGRRIAAERDRAEEMAEFTAGLFEAGTPARTLDFGMLLPAETLLLGVARKSRELSDEADLRADQQLILGRVYRSIGLGDAAEQKLLESLRLKERVYGASHPEVISRLNGLASLYVVAGRSDEAEALLKHAVEIGASSGLAYQHEIAITNTLQASVCWNRGAFENAISHLRVALAITERTRGQNHPEVAVQMASLAEILHVVCPGSREAEKLFRRALTIQTELPGGDPNIWRTLERLGLFYVDQHRLSEAATILEASIDALHESRVFDQINLARLSYTLGRVEWLRGNLAAAEFSYKNRLSFEKSAHPEKWEFFQTPIFSDLASVVLARGDLQEAHDLWQETLANWVRGSHGFRYADFSQHLAILEQRRGASASGEARMQEALAKLKEHADESDPGLAPILARAALFFREEGDFERAEPLLRRAITLWDQSDRQHPPAYPLALCDLGETVMELGNIEEAEELLRRARRLIEEQRAFDPSPRKNEVLAEIQLARGDLYRLRGEIERPEVLWRESLRLLELNPEGAVGATHRLLAIRAWLNLGRPEQARPYAEVLIEQGWMWPPFLDQFR